MHMHMRDHDKMLVLYVPHQKKSFTKYRWWQITLIPVVSSNGMTYTNVVSVPTKKSQIYMSYITTYLPSGVYVFNIARASLHTLRECIHVLQKRQ
jgi:hypothetical protein